jgi:uncharacterized membrane protein
MAQENVEAPKKIRIESLSDLIFGLALSIGALTLIGQSPSDFQGMLLSIAFYAFSFIILISVWYSYTRTMSVLHVATTQLLSLNILLLFLVSIEPYLFNQLLHSTIQLVEYTSVIYAFDLGGLFAIQAFLANIISTDKSKTEQIRRSFRLRRNTLLLSTALFFISALPVFWTWSIHIGGGGAPLRLIIWLIPLLLPSTRRFLEKRQKSQQNK